MILFICFDYICSPIANPLLVKIFVLTSRFPYPLEKGDKLRAFRHIQALSEEHEVHLHCVSHQQVDADQMEALQPYCKEIHVYRLNTLQMILGLIWALTNNKPMSIGYFYNSSIKERIQTAFNNSKADAVYCQLIRMAEYAKDLPSFRVIDFMDSFSLIMERRMESAGKIMYQLFRLEKNRLKAYEENIHTNFNKYFFISENDSKVISHNPKKSEILSNGIDIQYFSPTHNSSRKSYDLVFVGNMGYHPNVAAAHFIVSRILPQLKEQRLLIAGARPAHSIQLLENEYVHVSGWLEDIRTAYGSAHIFIAPIFMGSGQQNKVLEAMSMGMPCLVTSQVNEAIGAIPGEAILLAETAEDFVKGVVKLQDETYRNQVGRAARQFIESKYPWEQVNKLLLKTFQEESNLYK